jgi:hypothetical protein
VSDSLTDRLDKQKSANAAKLAYVEKMKERAARIDAEQFAQRIPRATEFLNGVRDELVRRITSMAAAASAKKKSKAPVVDILAPFPVPKEFDGFKGPERDIRNEQDIAHEVWAGFVKWGTDNGLKLVMVTETAGTFIRLDIG